MACSRSCVTQVATNNLNRQVYNSVSHLCRCWLRHRRRCWRRRLVNIVVEKASIPICACACHGVHIARALGVTAVSTRNIRSARAQRGGSADLNRLNLQGMKPHALAQRCGSLTIMNLCFDSGAENLGLRGFAEKWVANRPPIVFFDD